MHSPSISTFSHNAAVAEDQLVEALALGFC